MWLSTGRVHNEDNVMYVGDFNNIKHRHTGERPDYNWIANSNIGNKDKVPALAISSNVVSRSKPPPMMAERPVVINDNVVNLPPPLVQSLQKPNENIVERVDVKLVDNVNTIEQKAGFKTETDKQVVDAKTDDKHPDLEAGTVNQGSAEIVTDVKAAEDPDLRSFERELVKEETEEIPMKDIKAAIDSDFEASAIAQQDSGPGETKVNVEDDWGDFEEAFGDEQEVGEGNEEVIGSNENLNDLLHADSDEEVGDGVGLDNVEVNGDDTEKDMDAEDKVVI